MLQRDFATQVVRQLRQAGFQAYWAGGCVRDLLLGIEPADFDIATNAQPMQIRQLFGHRQTLPVGAAFGVIIVLAANRQTQVEVATFRSDSTYSDGRRPDYVTFSSAQEDAQRRDFTINGMFYDPIAQAVIDYVGGQADLAQGLIRAIGQADARIGEDKLRMLRAVRIAARFGFAIESQTYQAITRHASEAVQVSGERLAVELYKTLETNNAPWAVQAWAATGLLQVLLPEVASVWHRTECSETAIALLDHCSGAGWLARLSGLLWAALGPLAADCVKACQQRLKLANEDAIAMRFAIHHQETLVQADTLPWSQVQPLLVSPWISTAVELLAMRAAVGQTSADTVAWIRQRLSWPSQRLNPSPLLTGQDLLRAGLSPGPRFKVLLQAARNLQLDGGLSDTDAALRWLKHIT
ncbi:MAG: CCA tRNA nucleotidyltransferase [Pirellulaceae bacterium]|nr:CCA tRNA nucleotidyltransferase [Pirellulaceae bacterium]